MADLILDLLVEESVLLELGVSEQVFLNAEGSYVTVPGPTGATGPQGAQGIQGIQGVTGNQGTPGADGLDGNTILFGNIAPTNLQGIDDNFYIDLITWNFYQKKTGSWNLLGKIKGDSGTNGTNGVGIVSIVRTSGTGAAGTTDTYTITYTNATTSTFNVYNGANGAQGIQGIQGIQGATGATGAAGTNGTNGTNGVGVPTGGTAGQILTKIDATNYNTYWQDNFADWTSVVKHTVKNNGLAGTISKGTAVYVTGSDGTNMLVGKASNASEATSSKTMGLMQSDITTTGGTQTGFVITEGLLSGLNTAGQTAGDPVWLGVNGALIYGLANKPYAPAHLVFIGIVTKVSAGSGEIFVKVQNGFELKEIHDVDLISSTPTNNQLLSYNSATGLWKNKTVALADILAAGNTTNNQVIRSNNFNSYVDVNDSYIDIVRDDRNILINDTAIIITEGTFGSSIELLEGDASVTFAGRFLANSEDVIVTSSLNSALSTKQNTLTLTTTGTSGPATLVGATLNIPQYSGGGGAGEPAIRKAQPRITRETYY